MHEWAEADPEHARELLRIRMIWQDGGLRHFSVDVDAAWEKVNARMEGGSVGADVIPITGRSRPLRWIAAAALFAGLIMGVRYLFEGSSIQLMATTEFVRTMLPDSSAIVLSPNSRLEARIRGDRHIELNGEAYFEVKRDEQRPFIVETDGVTVTVLGTAFEVSAFDTSSSIMVRVRHGKVRVVAGADSVVLPGGEYARYHKGAHFLERMPAPPSEVWGDRIIQFHDTPLAQVVEQLQTLFKVRVQLGNGTLARCTLTATFEDEPIDYILRVIADTYGATLNMEAIGSYTLIGDGC